MLKSQIMGRAQNHPNGPKWVENGRQASRIHPSGSPGRSRAFGTGPAAKNPAAKSSRPTVAGRSYLAHPHFLVPIDPRYLDALLVIVGLFLGFC